MLSSPTNAPEQGTLFDDLTGALYTDDMPGSKEKIRPDVSAILKPGSNRTHRHIQDRAALKALVDELKEQKFRVVLTQGVFDLIHEGHAKYLEMAKSYGDVLIVGVDSDELTRIRKGKNRPVVPQEERIEMLVHLRHVDMVVLREAGEDIGDLIRLVKPDCLVTSHSTKDFTEQMARDYDGYAKRIVTLPPQAISTTSARVRDLTIEGAENLANEISTLTKDFIDKIRKG
jgi:rfaE bifunctional protein nucleotidyltransferase chain/domain